MPTVIRVRRPLFATLMHFPAACFLLTLTTDIIFACSYNVTWETCSVWLLTFGLLTALPILLLGLIEAFGRGLWPSVAARIGYAAALLLAIANVFVHSRDGYTAVVPVGITLSALTAIVLLATWAIDIFVPRDAGPTAMPA